MTDITSPPAPNRCRLTLIVDDEAAARLDAQSLTSILSAADVASVNFIPGSLDESGWQPLVEPLVAATQALNRAAIVSDYSRIAGRVGADGLQLGQDPVAIEEAIEKFSPRLMVGAANIKSRHTALVIGELQPDYVMFGKPGHDTRPEPHPKNLALGEWWADMVEIPAITLGGSSIDSVETVAKTGVEFVALGAAIFAPDQGDTDISTAAERVLKANQLLDDHAPKFEYFDE